MDSGLLRSLASVLAQSSPLVFAGLGETLTERAGVINLSLDGSILLSAMVAFAVAYTTNSLLLGFLAAMVVGALVALLIAFASISLRQDQVAVGFVLFALCTELSSFLGKPFVRKPGPSVPHWPIPLLSDLPIVGPLFFSHNLVVYLSFLLIPATWWWIARTQPGLKLQGVGERPEAAFARGVNVHRLRYLYTVLGGALVGFAGAAYSLSVKLGWSHRHTAGNGWIALAIVIFGGWHPIRVALGAYLFGGLKSLASTLQRVWPQVPTQVFQVAPFALMLLALLLVSSDLLDRLTALLPPKVGRPLRNALRGSPPAALGTAFIKE
ncbi:MAG: ABC transporter permease [Chloroflexi bacterium]|nr:MAG: ABC transporter permease [Chloroflexota bacterium]